MQFSDFFSSVGIIAIVGMSDNENRPSFEVGTYLQRQGFRIIPVNPHLKEVLGEISYPDLLSIPKEIHIDVVDIFRRSSEVLPHIKEAVTRGDVKTIWMQEGIQNSEAEKYARDHGLEVISNFCLMKAHKKNKLNS